MYVCNHVCTLIVQINMFKPSTQGKRNSTFHECRYNNYSTIDDTIQAKGAIYFATLQGYIIFETDLYKVYSGIRI